MEYKTKGIAFKNFRRFQNFPMLELGPITYMVGRNNSGKSTMVKAYLLMIDYLQNHMFDTFSFDAQVLEEVNIVTFGRALFNQAESPEIGFGIRIGELVFKVIITAEEDDTKANVLSFEVRDDNDGIKLYVDYVNETIQLSKKQKAVFTDDKLLLDQRDKLNTDLIELKKNISMLKEENIKELLLLTDRLNKIASHISFINKKLRSEEKKEEEFIFNVTQPLHFLKVKDMYEIKDDEVEDNEEEIVFSEDTMIQEFVSIVLYHNEIQYKKDLDESRNNNDERVTPDSFELYQNTSNIKKWAAKVRNKINEQAFYYIPANPSKQSALFYLRDTNNILSQAIHQFYQLGIEKGQEEWIFVEKWMSSASDSKGQSKGFDIGNSFEIEMRAGEAYEFNIYEKDSIKPESLSDKGMGSLQAMTLILKIASLIRLSKNNKKVITVLVEEPELNLHPALQSKLTDFFHEVYTKYGFNFILETHSEYIIRRSQLLALKNDYLSNQEVNPNPFSIFYFHKEDGPYQMDYNSQGKFNRDFGSGFYDEAGSTTLKIIKKLRENQVK